MKKYKVLESFIYYNRKDNTKKIILKDTHIYIIKNEQGGWIGHVFYNSIVELYDSSCIFIGYDISTYFNKNILTKLKYIEFNNVYLFWKNKPIENSINNKIINE